MKRNGLLLIICMGLFGMGTLSFAQSTNKNDCINNWWNWVLQASLGNEYACEWEDQTTTTSNPSNPSNQPAASQCNGVGEKDPLVPLTDCACTGWYIRINKKCVDCTDPGVCCGVKLNTSIPFIGNCIETKAQDATNGLNDGEAFPLLMGMLTKILISVILITSFVLIVVAGVMIATGNPKWGKDMIVKVAVGLAILWASGVILRLINPNFFG